MKAKLELGNPTERYRLLTDWGGTTTANRRDWRRIVIIGQQEGWYTITFGKVDRVEQDSNGRLITYLDNSNFKGEIKLDADFIIDATGLDAKPAESPFLNDLVTHYNLPLNPLGRLMVANDFELVEMRMALRVSSEFFPLNVVKKHDSNAPNRGKWLEYLYVSSSIYL